MMEIKRANNKSAARHRDCANRMQKYSKATERRDCANGETVQMGCNNTASLLQGIETVQIGCKHPAKLQIVETVQMGCNNENK